MRRFMLQLPRINMYRGRKTRLIGSLILFVFVSVEYPDPIQEIQTRSVRVPLELSVIIDLYHQ